MAKLENKIDFVMFFSVENANPNGDPLNGNMPRNDYDGYGEVSDVCIKRKIRNRLQDAGEKIFVQANDRIEDDLTSLEARFDSIFRKDKDDDETVYSKSCELWIDVRSFGQVVTFQNRSIGIRGPVSVSMAKSLSPVNVISMQITRSTNGMKKEKGGRSSDTMGTKHYIDFGLYKVKGSINPYFAEKTGFTMEDALKIKEALRTLFVNDASSARPEGSMEVKKLYWFTHPGQLGVASSAKIHSIVDCDIKEGVIKPLSYNDYEIKIKDDELSQYKEKGLRVEVIEGI
ncbi:MAG: type I-C CRISPR-associated protein Cas7/Csd2 [Clostridiales bacterium]|jgi:CRISPR-associated protein Csd2|nr:type I-C CRISPR-associated protein Cas7/Csd2 [Clostridiales bacterium]